MAKEEKQMTVEEAASVFRQTIRKYETEYGAMLHYSEALDLAVECKNLRPKLEKQKNETIKEMERSLSARSEELELEHTERMNHLDAQHTERKQILVDENSRIGGELSQLQREESSTWIVTTASCKTNFAENSRPLSVAAQALLHQPVTSSLPPTWVA